jgi:peroxiredoxin
VNPKLRHYAIGLLLAFFVGGYVIHALSTRSSAPDITFTTLDGKKISLSDQKGKLVLVNFWATTCGYCMNEMPNLVIAYNRFRDKGLEIVAIAMPNDSSERVNDYTRQHNLPFPVALDATGEAYRAFDTIQGTPTSFLIDRNGKIIETQLGGPDFEKFDAFLTKQLS